MASSDKKKLQTEQQIQPRRQQDEEKQLALDDILAEARALKEEAPEGGIGARVQSQSGFARDDAEEKLDGLLHRIETEGQQDEMEKSPLEEVPEQPDGSEQDDGIRKGGFGSFFRGLFTGRKKPVEDEPDEMMLKYGNLKLYSADEIYASDRDGEEPSFGYLFGEKDDTDDEETAEEYNVVFEKIHQQRIHKLGLEQKDEEITPVPKTQDTRAEIKTPAEEEVPAKIETPAEEEVPAEIETPAEEEIPAEIKTPAEEEVPAEIKTPAEEEVPAEIETPAEEEVPAEIETPAEEEVPAEIKTPAEEEIPAEIKTPAEEEVPAEIKTPAEEEVPSEIKTPAEEEVPAEIKTPAEEEVPAEIKTPAEEEVPAEIKTPAEEEVPAEIETPAEEEIPIEIKTPEEQEVPAETDVPGPGESVPAGEPNAPAQAEAIQPEGGQGSGDAANANTIEFNIFNKEGEPESKFEKNFGKCVPAPSAARAEEEAHGTPGTGEDVRERTRRLYYAGEAVPDMPVKAGKFSETLRREYGAYTFGTAEKSADAAGKEAPLEDEPRRPAEPMSKTPKTRKSRKFVILGEEEENDPAEELPEAQVTEEEIDDYGKPEDAPSVRADLVDGLRRLFLRTAVSAAAFMAVLALLILNRVGLPAFSGSTGGLTYLIVNFVILAAVLLCCWGTVKNGFSALASLHCNEDTALAFAGAAVFLQGAVSFFKQDSFVNGGLSVYAALAVFGFFLNSLGKFIMQRRVFANFKFITSPEQKFVAKIIDDRDTAAKMFKGVGTQEPIIAYQRKTGFLTDFLKLSFEPDPSERLAGKIAPFGILCSVAVGVGGWLITRDWAAAVSAFAVSACVCVPVCAAAAVNMPMRRLCKTANKVGAMLIGYPAVRQFADVNAVLLDADTLYPRDRVVLHGIKTFGGQRVDEAILDAAAIMRQVGGPLAAPFDQIIKGKSGLLPKVDSLAYEDDMGILAWVGGRRVLVGNRRLMESHGIAPPSRDYEKKYVKGDRQITYLAVAGDLVAMFVTSYTPDHDIAYEMQQMENNGVSFLIRTADPNITAKLVADHFRVFFRDVKILPGEQAQVYKGLADTPVPKARAYLATGGKDSAAARMITACIRARSGIAASLILQIIGIVLGFVLVAFLSFYAGVAQLGALEMLCFAVFWALAALIVPWVRKP